MVFKPLFSVFKGAEEYLHPSHPKAVACPALLPRHLGQFVGTAEAAMHSPLTPGGSAHTSGRKARLALPSSAPLAISLCQLQCPPKQSASSANWANWKLTLPKGEKNWRGGLHRDQSAPGTTDPTAKGAQESTERESCLLAGAQL